MHPEDLRVGNYIYLEVGLPSLDIHTVLAKDLAIIEGLGDKVFPIPLTEDALSDLGYEEITEGHWKWRDEEGYLWGVCEIFWNARKGFYHGAQLYDYEGLKFVHQLQNLYYALTGEELKYNESN